MKNKNIKKYLINVFVLLFSTVLLATPGSDFSSGVNSFNAGDYLAAVTYFESSLTKGNDSIALHYNLASSYYKLGKYGLAKKHFNQVAKADLMRDLADYNLGLIALKQKQSNTARQYFNSIVSSSKDEKLIRLSKKQLVELENTVYKLNPYLSFMLGYDDNVVAVPDDSDLNRSDSFYRLYAAVDKLVVGRKKDGWVANGYYSGKKYSTEDVDSDVFGLGIKREKRLKNWETSTHFSLVKDYYAGEDYLTSANIFLRGKKRLSANENFYLSYKLDRINSDDRIYDYLEGWSHRARAEYRSYSADNIKLFYYEFEKNNRGILGTESSVYSYNYSPTRHTVRGQYTHILDDKWRIKGDIERRISDYPVSSTMDRSDVRWKLALSTDYRIDRTFKLTAKYEFTDQASTEDRYDYKKSVIQVGLSKLF